MREIGRIRLGDQVPDKNGKPRAHMLEAFRLTSSSRDILALAAKAYGGEVTPWPDGPADWQLYTTSTSLPIAIPPSEEPYSQWLELWSAGGCQRRCDGVTVLVPTEKGMRERKCMCDPDGPKGRECVLTTRLSVMLPDVPVLGIWRLESRGEYAARELPGVMALIASASRTGVILPGELRIEKREVKKAQEKFPRRFVVPVIDLQVPLRDLLPGGALTGGELPPPASGRPALPSGTALPQENGFDDPDPVVEEAGWGEPPPLPQSGGTVASDPPAPDPEPARPSTPEARAAWNRLFHENGIEPDEGARRKMRGVLTDCGVSVDDLVDYPTFAGVWLAARRRFGRSLGGHTAATDDEPATFQTPVPSRESGVYCVTLRPGGPDECTCKAGQHRRKCHHLPVAIGYLRMWASENDALGRGLQKDFLVLLALEEGAEEAAA